NNFLKVTIVQPIPLNAFNPAFGSTIYPLPVQSIGNPDLNETTLDAYEISYTGTIAQGRAIVSAAFYVNEVKDDIFFTEDKTKRYFSANPPPGWPPPLVPALHLIGGPRG